MTAEEFGVYWRLVCHSWSKGGLPNDDHRLALMAGQCSGSAIAYAKAKFELCPDGLLRNPRLEKVRQEQLEYRKKQSENAKLGWSKRKPLLLTNGDATALPPQMGSQCSPSPTPSPKDKEREQGFPEVVVPSREEVKRMAEMHNIPPSVAEAFFDHYDSKNLWANRYGQPINVLNSLIVWNKNERNRPRSAGPNGSSAGGGAGERPRSVFELKTIKETKEQLATALRNKFATEGPLGMEWSDQGKRQEYAKLRAEIKALQQQIAGMA